MSRNKPDIEPRTGYKIWVCQACHYSIGIPAKYEGLLDAMVFINWAIHDDKPLCPMCKDKVPSAPKRRSLADYPAVVQTDMPW